MYKCKMWIYLHPVIIDIKREFGIGDVACEKDMYILYVNLLMSDILQHCHCICSNLVMNTERLKM